MTQKLWRRETLSDGAHVADPFAVTLVTETLVHPFLVELLIVLESIDIPMKRTTDANFVSFHQGWLELFNHVLAPFGIVF